MGNYTACMSQQPKRSFTAEEAAAAAAAEQQQQQAEEEEQQEDAAEEDDYDEQQQQHDGATFHNRRSCAHLYHLTPWPPEGPPLNFTPSDSEPNKRPPAPLQQTAQRSHQPRAPQSPTIQSPSDDNLQKMLVFAAPLQQQNHLCAVARNIVGAQSPANACELESPVDSTNQLGTQQDGRMPHGAVTQEKNGLVRLKVIISKKQLSKIMSPTCSPSNPESDAALMNKMVVSLLSHMTKSCEVQPSKCHQPWRPSLDQIPEGYPT